MSANIDHGLEVEVLSPAKSISKINAKSVIAPGSVGYLAVLANHAPFVSEMGVGVLSLDQNKHFFVSGGYLQVVDNKVKVLADVVEEASDVDVDRAKAAQQRAIERLQKKILDDQTQSLDWNRANQSLRRARTRIDFKLKSGK